MKRLAFALALFPVVAWAQDAPVEYHPLDQVLVQQARQCETLANMKLGEMQKQLAALQKENEALKAHIAPAAQSPMPAADPSKPQGDAK